MTSRAALAALIVCLVAVPGCSTLGGSDTGTVETLTPAPVTVDDSTPPPAPPAGSLPPGVSPNGTVDVQRLVAAHESSLAGRTYRWKFAYGATGENRALSLNFTRVVLVGSDAFSVNQTTSDISAKQTLFVADGTGYLRSVRDRDVKFETVREPSGHYSLAFSGQVLRRFLTGVTVDVTSIEVDGQTYYRLHVTDGEVPLPLERERGTVRDFTVTAYVTPEGFVRSVAVEYDRIGPRGSNRVRARYDYTDLDGVTVERPDWVSQVPSNNTVSDRNGSTTSTDDGPERSDGGTSTDDRTPSPNGTAREPTAAPTGTSTPTYRLPTARERRGRDSRLSDAELSW